jgi:hypothetical protein
LRLLDDVSRTEADDAIAGDSRGLGHRSQRRRVTKVNGASRDQSSAALWVTTKTDMFRDQTRLVTPAERVPEITEFGALGRKPARRQIGPIRGASISTERRDRTSSSERLAPRTERHLSSACDRNGGAPNDRSRAVRGPVLFGLVCTDRNGLAASAATSWLTWADRAGRQH